MNIIELLCKKYRATLLILVLGILYSLKAYFSISKESTPEIKVPVIYAAIILRGAAPEDIDRMIIKTLDNKLLSISGVKKIESKAALGYASIRVEFEAGFDTNTALTKVKDKIDETKSDLPNDIEEPIIKEVDFSRFPVLYVMLHGTTSKDTLIAHARDLKRTIENAPGVLEVKLSGDKEEVVEIVTDIAKMQAYNITPGEVANAIRKNNTLIPLGKISNSKASFSVKLSGLLKDLNDIKNTPIRAYNGQLIKISDIGNVILSFRDVKNIARVDRNDAVVLEVSKRAGTSAIDVIQNIKKLVLEQKKDISQDVKVTFSRDVSKDVLNSLEDLQNNIIIASILVIIVTVIFIGKKQSVIVGLSIPISFLLTIGTIYALGYTLNMVVLFGLILATGMIVDASIIVVEYADNLIQQSVDVQKAYIEAAMRMMIPVLSATVGIIIVYFPLLAWPGIVGKFMKYIPIALITVLSYSIVCALLLVPVIGTFIEKTRFKNLSSHTESKLLDQIFNLYNQTLFKILNKPKIFVKIIVSSVIIVFIIYSIFGHGVEFFPKAEPKNIQITVISKGNISTQEKVELATKIETIVLESKVRKDIQTYYNKVIVEDRFVADEIINIADIELKDWDKRRKAKDVISIIKKELEGIHGVQIKVEAEKSGPSNAKPIVLQISSTHNNIVDQYANKYLDILKQDNDLIDIEDSRVSEKIEFVVNFDKTFGGIYNVSILDMYAPLAMATTGYIIGTYKPDHLTEDIDIIMRYPAEYRKVSSLDQTTIPIFNSIKQQTQYIDIKKFSKMTAQKEKISIEKINGLYSVKLTANVKNGVVANNKIKELRKKFASIKNKDGVIFKFGGDTESQKETGQFLINAFSIAIFAKFIILVWQYNSIYYALLTLSAVVLSISGVLLMLLVTFKTFGVVMCGLGIISIAGVVVSNNIIFIDTFQELINEHKYNIRDAIIKTATSRLRPILATSLTAITGLIPMMFNIGFDFFHLKFVINSPSGQWWEQLSATIAGGLCVSTLLTLTFTPAMLMLKAPRNEE